MKLRISDQFLWELYKFLKNSENAVNFLLNPRQAKWRFLSEIKNPVFKKEDASYELAEDPVVIFAGRFVSYKNLPLLMRAFDKVRKQLRKGRLVLIGDGPEKVSLLKCKDELASKDAIEFMDKLSQDKLFEHIKACAFAIAPALNEFNPNFILESLSFGKPVIISRGNGLSVSLPDAFLFDPFSEEDLVTKMSAILQPDNYKKAVQAVRDTEMNQTWEKVTDFHLNLIKETVR